MSRIARHYAFITPGMEVAFDILNESHLRDEDIQEAASGAGGRIFKLEKYHPIIWHKRGAGELQVGRWGRVGPQTARCDS